MDSHHESARGPLDSIKYDSQRYADPFSVASRKAPKARQCLIGLCIVKTPVCPYSCQGKEFVIRNRLIEGGNKRLEMKA